MLGLKTGLFGGTFNPVHCGHIHIVHTMRERLGLHRVVLMPAGTPPHKDYDEVGAEHRYNMLRLAFDGEPGVVVSDLELSRQGKSYTADTLETLRREYPADELYLLCGSDMFLTLQDWYRSRRIFELCTIAAMARDSGEYERLAVHAGLLEERYGASVRILQDEPLPISSTQIRDRIAAGEAAGGLLPEPVRAYIEEHKLYRNRDGND